MKEKTNAIIKEVNEIFEENKNNIKNEFEDNLKKELSIKYSKGNVNLKNSDVLDNFSINKTKQYKK